MKNQWYPFIVGITLLTLACGSVQNDAIVNNPDPNNGSESPRLSSEQIQTIGATLGRVMRDVEPGDLSSRLTQTLGLSHTFPCPIAGVILVSGQISVEQNPFSVTGDGNLQLSDPTDATQACEIDPDLLLEGGLALHYAASQADSVQMTLRGSIGVNYRGPFGNLIPLAPDCEVDLAYLLGQGGISGTVCGEAYIW